jgi:chemotaxis signal transduction protein
MVEAQPLTDAAEPNLDVFVDEEAHRARDEQAAQASVHRDLLVFEFGRDRFAVDARRVESVVPWRAPSRIPGTDARVHGVIQDRGRIVVVMAHPAGITPGPNPPEGKLIVVCNSARGHIGLPASSARAVGNFSLSTEPSKLSVHDSAFGAFTFVDPFDYGATA